MKILIVSDTHRSHKNLEKVLEKTKGIDCLIHLGDTEGGEDYIRALFENTVHIVSGNNDFFSDLPGEEEFDLCGKHFFLTHGHPYYVSLNVERLLKEAKFRNADIVIFGHTHKPFCEERDGVWILNPGSIAYPRQKGRRCTYMIMDLEEGKKPEIQLFEI